MAKSSFFPLYQKVADVMRKRVLNGDYALKPIPSERRLADELGVNAMTARHGIQILEQEGLLVRQPNGRVAIKKVQHGEKRHLNLAFLAPTLISHWIESCRLAIERTVETLGGNVRTVVFTHWEDPLLLDALSGFDGIFLVPFPDPVPPATAERLRNKQHPVVVVDYDFTEYGIPSIRLFPSVHVQKLLNHLEACGHTRIGCMNAQPNTTEITDRINVWRYWMEAHNFTARLINEPVPPYGQAMRSAYQTMTRILTENRGQETAWFCTTIDCAIGAMKAIQEHGLRPGHDIAIGAANGEGIAEYMTPAITALESADPTPFISYCVRWMMDGGTNWQGPLLMQPTEIPLVIRASTQPGIVTKPA